MTARKTRRETFALFTAAALLGAPRARGQEAPEYPLHADDGGPLMNFRIPAELDPATLPGIVWAGAKSGDVVLYEWFDYNCGYCRKAAADLDAMLKRDPKLRLGLINNAILSIGSVQAAKVQQGLLRLNGPAAAYDFHLRMFQRHGQNDGVAALDVVADMGLDAKKVADSANAQSVTEAMTRQARLAQSLGMPMTPSFAITGVGILGWPGAKSMQAIIASARKCDHPACG
jgi:protein-disulfide isomerase